VRALAETHGATILNWEADNLQRIEDCFNEMVQGNNLGAVLLIGDALFFANRQRVAELSLNGRLPLIAAGVREFASAGALMSYGANIADSFRRSAVYVGKILKGAKPADLPIEESTQFDLALNLKTARALGLSVPSELIVSANEVVE
jgi:putative ABC transport system substrate-binding protein